MTRTIRKLPIFLSLVFLAIYASTTTAQETKWEVQSDHWYVIEIADAKAGWMNVQTLTDGEQFKTITSTKLSIGRGGVTIEITMESSFIETSDGKPVLMTSRQNMSRMVIDQQWKFLDDKVLHVSKQGGRIITKQLSMPEGEWFTPLAAERYIAEQIEAGKMEISYRMLTSEQGIRPVGITMTYVGDDLFDNEQISYTVTVWTTENDVLPIDGRVMFTSEGLLVYSELEAQFGRMVTRLSTETEAKAKDDQGEVPELMVSTFIKPDKAIDRPHETKTARIRLRAKKGKLPEIPSAGAQRVEDDPDSEGDSGGGGVILTINIDDNLDAEDGDAENDDFLEPSMIIDSSDPLVQKYARRYARRAGKNVFDRAEALRKFVHKHISKKGLATAFASASETVRMRTGDCSEHGVLLAALLRADGIPARITTGLVYAESFGGEKDIFGWHMWTQALIDGKWVDFDATLPVRYSAAHVLTGTSSLAEGIGSTELSSLLVLLGNLEIEVLEVGYGEEGGRD